MPYISSQLAEGDTEFMPGLLAECVECKLHAGHRLERLPAATAVYLLINRVLWAPGNTTVSSVSQALKGCALPPCPVL